MVHLEPQNVGGSLGTIY